MERDSYVPAVAIGAVMRSVAAAKVIASRHAEFREGDLLSGFFGWQDFAVSRGGERVSRLPSGVPVPTALGLLGLTGLSGYFGMLDIGEGG